MPETQEQPSIQIVTQYIKDFSFENPNVPESFTAGWGAPDATVQIGVNQRTLKDNLHEATLSVRIEARNAKEDKVAFIAEVLYGALVALKGVPPESVVPVLSVEVPKLLFPFARETLTSLTLKGGHPPLNLMPINFEALFLSELKRRQQASSDAEAGAAPAAAPEAEKGKKGKKG